MAFRRFAKNAGVASCGAAGLYTTYWIADRWIINAVPAPPDPRKFVETKEVFRQRCEKLLGYEVVVRQHWTADRIDPEAHIVTAKTPLTGEQPETPADVAFRKVKQMFRFMLSNREDGGREARRKENRSKDEPVQVTVEGKVPMHDHDAHRGTKYASMSIQPTGRGTHSLESLLDNLTNQSFHRCGTEVVSGLTGDPTVCIPDTTELPASYLRVMLGALTLLQAPIQGNLRVAAVGVAGGSFPMFLQRYFAPLIGKLDLVDVEPVCFEAATKKLGLRALSDIRMELMAKDGLFFLNETVAAKSNYDAIFVDAFIGCRIPSHIEDFDFIISLRNALKSTGVCAMNIPTNNMRFLHDFKQVFGSKNVFIIRAPGSSNCVILACRNVPMHGVSKRHIVRRARQLSSEYRLPFDLGNHFPLNWSIW